MVKKERGEVIEEVRRKKGDGVGRRRGIHKGVQITISQTID